MKKINLLAGAAALALAASLTGCADSPPPPGSWDDYDPDIVGTWELSEWNGRPVSGYSVNYMQFYNNGSGTLYAYENGLPYQDPFNYQCFWRGDDTYTLNLYYADGMNSSVTYWYEGQNADYLVMQWVENGRRQEYVYVYCDNFYWDAPATRTDAAVPPQSTPRPGAPQ